MSNTSILNPESPRWDEFAARLNSAVLAIGCRHDTSCAETMMCSMDNIDIAGSLAFCQRHDGFCDCEIIYNVVLREEDA
jgi:hypothetical protein